MRMTKEKGVKQEEEEMCMWSTEALHIFFLFTFCFSLANLYV